MELRILKALALAMVMYFSLRFLGISAGTSLVISLVPAVLGSLNILAGPAYGMTALVFILACCSTLIPELKIDTGSVAKAVAPFLNRAAL